ncbi:MAG: hypothetical protein ABJG78_14970 [Cyclobacteriaceae bacterium]
MIKQSFEPIAYVGDDLSDFTSVLDPDEPFTNERRAEILKTIYDEKIGKSWFLIPNPNI